MVKTITVKGIGKATISPDLVVISMKLETREKDYEYMMEVAAGKIEALNNSLEQIGFEKKSVKTKDFYVDTDYERIKERNGDYKKVFVGYVCNHHLKIEFDFDTKLLAKTLSAIAKCVAQPEISISFTVKDPSAVNEELLLSATANARGKARILCEASGAQLGDLVNIDYNWGEISLFSPTLFKNDYMPMCVNGDGEYDFMDIDIEPDDIKTSDSATFVWEIK